MAENFFCAKGQFNMQKKNSADYADRYFTKSDIMCDHVAQLSDYFKNAVYFFDFSAGDGSLKTHLPRTVIYKGIDLNPMNNDIIQLDWFSEKASKLFSDFSDEAKRAGSLLMVGYNPPFGRAGHLSKLFLENIKTKADVIVCILPIRNWYPKGYKLHHREYLSKDSFFLPDSGDIYNASAEFVVLERDDSSDLSTTQYQVRASDTGKFDFWWTSECEKKVYLLVRKVGHYAGCQFYYFGRSIRDKMVRIMFYPGKGHKTQVPTDYGDINIFEKKPWEDNGHIICDTDEPPKTSGSTKRQKTTAKSRQGTGFLKIYRIDGNVPDFSFDQFTLLCSNFETFILQNNLNTGAPKSISAAITERFFLQDD